MIVNKIRRKSGRASSRSAFAYMSRLSRYIVRADAEDLRKLITMTEDSHLHDLVRYATAAGEAEKALASGARNLLSDELEGWEPELAAIMHHCPDNGNALDHWVISWQAGEKPSIAEVKETVDLFAHCLGVDQCPVVWGYHGDTKNNHVHLAMLRIDPETGKRVTAANGWDIDAAHRALAVIESRFPHFGRETRSRYEVVNGRLQDRKDNRDVGPADRPKEWVSPKRETTTKAAPAITTDARLAHSSKLYEAETGYKSRERIAIEVAVPIVLRSDNFRDCHRLLAEEGIQLRREKSGAAFIIDGKPVKASIDRRTSLKNLELRLGSPLIAADITPKQVDRREMWPEDPIRREYYRLKAAHDDMRASVMTAARTALAGGNGAAKAAIAGANASAAFPTFAAWAAGAQISDPAEVISAALSVSFIAGGKSLSAQQKDPVFQQFQQKRLRGRTVYRPVGKFDGQPAFVDVGTMVVVHATQNREAVRASLLLMASRFPNGPLLVSGDKRFIRLAREIANQEQIEVLTPKQKSAGQQAELPVSKSLDINPDIRRGQSSASRLLAANKPVILAITKALFRSDWDYSHFRASNDLRQNADETPAPEPRTEADVPIFPNESSPRGPQTTPQKLAHQVALAASFGR